MREDAKFEDGVDKPVHVKALDIEDTKIVSAIVQDAVLNVSDMKWDRKSRRFALLINRFRWEVDNQRSIERVRSLLVIEDVKSVATLGVNRTEADVVLSILTLDVTAGDDGQATLEVVLAGDGAIKIEVEAIELTLRDVTQPYLAPSRKRPSHD